MDVQVEEIGFLLIDQSELLSYFDARVQFSNLLVVNLHNKDVINYHVNCCYSSMLQGTMSKSSLIGLISTEGAGFSTDFSLGGDIRVIVWYKDILVALAYKGSKVVDFYIL